MRRYCTQNAGDCNTCALASYGRDCRNNPIADRDKKGTHITIRMSPAFKSRVMDKVRGNGTSLTRVVEYYLRKYLQTK